MPIVKFATILVMILAGAIGAGAAAAKKNGLHSKTGGATIKIVAFGDSLTAGYLLKPQHAFPVKLTKALKKRGYNVVVANAGVSGDTSAAGLARLDWAIPKDTDAVILELGANDALRGLSAPAAHNNLEKIVATLRSRNIEVLIAGVPAPPNFGASYAKIFDGMFVKIAQKHNTLIYKNFLKGIVFKPQYNLSDGMHPNPKGVSIIVTNIMPQVEKLIARVRNRRAAHTSN